MKKIIIGILLLAFLFIFSNFSQAQEGAFNNVLVKDLEAEYDDAKKVISGKATIGNFANQSFNSLSYSLQLLANGEGSGLGTPVDEKKSAKPFSIQPKGEMTESFTYEIPKGFPSGEYNFMFQLTDSRGRVLGFDHMPVTITQSTGNYLTVFPEKAQIEINQENHDWGLGAPAEKGQTVKIKFEVINNTKQPINDIIPHLTVYPYTTTLEKVEEKDLPVLSFQAGEKKELAYEMTNFKKPQSYTGVIELKKNGKLVALPVRGHWVVEGMQGKIFGAGIDQNKNFNIEVVGSPYSVDKEGAVFVQIKDEKGSIYFSQNKKLKTVGPATQNLSFSLKDINFNGEYNGLLVKADFKISGQLVDTYKEKMSQDLMVQLKPPAKKEIKNQEMKEAITLALILMAIILAGVLAVMLLLKKNKSKNKKSNKNYFKSKGPFNAFFLLALSGFLAFALNANLTSNAKAWRADVGSYKDWATSWVDPFTHWINTQELKNYKKCLDNRNNNCSINSYASGGLSRTDGHRFHYTRIGWTSPYQNQKFKTKESIRISVSNVHSWCADHDHYGTKIEWVAYNRLTGAKAKEGAVSLNRNNRSHSWEIGSFDSGKYALYINARSNYGSFLYHGMIRYFEVEKELPSVDLKARQVGKGGYSDGPIIIPYNTKADLQWKSENADKCWLEGYGTRGWVDKPSGDNWTTPNLVNSQTYRINCYNEFDDEGSDSVTVQVGASPYKCTGSIPAGSSMCPGDNEKLTQNLVWQRAPEPGASKEDCSSRKCEYYTPYSARKSECGSLNGSIFNYDIFPEKWPTDGFCTNNKNPINGSPSFPAQGETVSWNCPDESGCSASRKSPPPGCNESCVGPNGRALVCAGGLSCLNGHCVNADCSTDANCVCNPNVTLNAQPSKVNYGGKTKLTWTIENAVRCDLPQDGGGTWNYPPDLQINPRSGQSETEPLKVNNFYYGLTCYNSAEEPGSGDATVTIERHDPKCGDNDKTFSCQEDFDNNECCASDSSLVGSFSCSDYDPEIGESTSWQCERDDQRISCQAKRNNCGASNWMETQIVQ